MSDINYLPARTDEELVDWAKTATGAEAIDALCQRVLQRSTLLAEVLYRLSIALGYDSSQKIDLDELVERAEKEIAYSKAQKEYLLVPSEWNK